ncbi:MAG: sulfopyruvate decarboxylase subunit beta [Candidatus Methanoperedens sp.]|nr:sulfopyruvate decarboxylase subunit beta [Candidatus Methanoperedens sp.]
MVEAPERRVVDILENNRIELAATLPCDRIKALLPEISKKITTIPLTREENGVGICAGAYLGGKKPVMVIQSTGIGNMINALESLDITCPHIVLLSPALWEGSSCAAPESLEISARTSGSYNVAEIRKPVMTRYEAIKIAAEVAGEDIIIANLGIPSKELYEIKDRELNFYMLGSMGLASSIGLGLALVQKKHVYVIDGDGSLLMNPNALTGIGAQDIDTLTIIAIDNAAYGSTGNQETCTRNQIDLEFLAKANGIRRTVKVNTEEDLKQALKNRASFIHTIVKPENAKCREIPLTAREIKQRFMKALEKEEKCQGS